jgi:phage-related protein
MFTLGSNLKFQLYNQATDMRKSFDSLSGLVTNNLNQDPCNGDVYIFINKSRNKIKLLHWTGNGFVLYYKKLENGRFEELDYDIEASTFSLSYSQLVMLIDGICIKNTNIKNRRIA